MNHSRTVILIRHGMPQGNIERRYIGRTDQPLSGEGIALLREKRVPPCDLLFCSPMKRCMQTAEILYPGRNPILVPDLRECDFGDFEGKNHVELDGNEYYQRWIDSGGELPFPNGETAGDFKRRCVDAFADCMNAYQFTAAAFGVHGGTIMAVMERFARPERPYYDYNVANGCGFIARFKGNDMIDYSSL